MIWFVGRSGRRAAASSLFLRRRAVAALPIAVAPRAPPGIRFDLERRRVPAMSAPRRTPADACSAHPASGPCAMRTDRVRRVGRTRRPIAARIADQRRKRPLVELDKAQKAPGWQARRHHKLLTICWIQDRVKRSRCGAPNLAPPALEGRSRDNAPVHCANIAASAVWLKPRLPRDRRGGIGLG